MRTLIVEDDPVLLAAANLVLRSSNRDLSACKKCTEQELAASSAEIGTASWCRP